MSERINLDDPNADLFGGNDDEMFNEEMIQKQLYGKNPNRVSGLNTLWYEELLADVDSMDIPEEAKRKMIFSMTANGILDMIADAVPEDLALDITYYFDSYLGVALTNKKFTVNLFEEHHKALMGINRDDFPDDETYELALEEFENNWWDIPQPLLEKRTPNDALRETMAKYGLTE